MTGSPANRQPPTANWLVALIGAGPIGLELAVAFKRAGIDSIQFDAGQIGATMQWYPLEMMFHSSADRLAIAGVPIQVPDQQKIKREEFLAYLRAIVLQFDLDVRTYERVESIERGGRGEGAGGRSAGSCELRVVSCAGVASQPATRNSQPESTVLLPPAPSALPPFTLQTNRGAYEASEIVLAIGAMHAPKLLDIPGEDLPHVSHYFRDPHTYFRKKLLIVGGRNSAIEAAVRCQRAGADVTISYRRDDFDATSVKFWLLPEIRSMIRDDRVRFLPRTWPVEIRERTVLMNTGDEVAAAFVLALTGYRQDTTLFEMLGIDLQGGDRKPRLDEETMETNVPGVFVAGTAIAGSPEERVRVIVEDCHVHVPRIVNAILRRHGRA